MTRRYAGRSRIRRDLAYLQELCVGSTLLTSEIATAHPDHRVEPSPGADAREVASERDRWGPDPRSPGDGVSE